MPAFEYTPPTEPHPIGVKAHQLYEQNGRRLPPAAVGAIAQDMKAAFGDIKTVADIVYSLGALLLVAEEHQADQAVVALRGLIRLAKPEIDRGSAVIRDQIQDEAQAARSSLTNFRGERYSLTATQVGAKRPENSVPLSSLMPNPALRPGR